MASWSRQFEAYRYAAESALERAHEAAATACAADLRRGLEDAREALRDAAGVIPPRGLVASILVRLEGASAKIEHALVDLACGALIELDTLLEEARTDVAACKIDNGAEASEPG